MKGNKIICLFLAALIWGFAFVAQSVGMDYVGPFTFTASRSLIGAVVLLPVIWFRTKKENGVKSGSPSKLIIQNAEYSYSAKSDRVTIKIGSLQNKSGGKSGSLRFELFMSKTGPYAPGSKISGFTLGISNTYEPLRVNSAYTNITSTVRSLEKKSGSYRPILFVKEQNEDNSWKIAAYANFPKTEKIL